MNNDRFAKYISTRKDISTRLAVIGVAIALAWLARPAEAQNCKDLPPGPSRKQCVVQAHPEAFEKKKENCHQLAEQRGSAGKASGQKDFMRSCMQGKITP